MSQLPPEFSVGIEEELFVIDRESGELVEELPAEVLQAIHEKYPNNIVAELLKSQIEIVSDPCPTVAELYQNVRAYRDYLQAILKPHNLAAFAASTHPFSNWRTQQVNGDQRYLDLVEELQISAQRLQVCGLHIHVGVYDEQARLQIMNQLQWFLPIFLLLSGSSPYWMGEDTGLNSYRTCVIDNLPRSGVNAIFKDLEEYQNYLAALQQSNRIINAREIWWDIRMNFSYPTIELRIADICTDLHDTMGLVALYLCLVHHLHKHQELEHRSHLELALTKENRWSAQRYTIKECQLFENAHSQAKPATEIIQDLLVLLQGEAESLHCVAELQHIHSILKRGTSADWQRRSANELMREYPMTQALTKLATLIADHT